MMNMQNTNSAISAFRVNPTALACPVVAFSDFSSDTLPIWAVISFFATCPKPMVFSSVNHRPSLVPACFRAAYINIRWRNKKALVTNGTYFLNFIYPERVPFALSLYAKRLCLTFFGAIARFTAVFGRSKKLYGRVFLLAYLTNEINCTDFALVVPLAFSATKSATLSGRLKAHYFVAVLARFCNAFAFWVRSTLGRARYPVSPKLFAACNTDFWWVFFVVSCVRYVKAKSGTKSTYFFSVFIYLISFFTFFTSFFIQLWHDCTPQKHPINYRECCLDNAKLMGC